jgi:hypothetical protein
VQAVGELDQHDAHIARHGEQHLAEVLGLRVLGRLEFDAVELGDAVHQLRHRLAEGVGDLVLGDRRVLGYVVQQRRHQRLAIQMPVGQDLGHRKGVRDVRVAGLARLAGVRGLGKAVRLGEAGDVRRLQVAEARGAEEVGGCRHGARLPDPSGVTTPDYKVGVEEAALRLSTSVPILPVAISRSAITVDLSRLGSTSGEAPAPSWRAR